MAKDKTELTMNALASLCKRRGFIFQSSEIYGGINGFWDYGPLGAELKRNIREAGWKAVVQGRENVVGLESGATIAVGGKLKGFPPRFYLYFRASQLFMGEADIRVPASGALCHVRRSYTGVVGGLRVVIPLLRHLRLNLEAGGGSLFSYNRYFEDGLNVEYQEDLVVAELGAGLNWRMYRWLSLGLMYGYTFVAEEERGDLIATMLEEADHGSSLGWSRLAATLGFHF